jgi:hypothetical protein
MLLAALAMFALMGVVFGALWAMRLI